MAFRSQIIVLWWGFIRSTNSILSSKILNTLTLVAMATKIEIFWNKIYYDSSYTEDITPVIKSSTVGGLCR